MCGIVGIASQQNVSNKLLESVKKLEYRGYDSVGMACIHEGEIHLKKDIGKIVHENVYNVHG